jgi:hypothetical protein
MQHSIVSEGSAQVVIAEGDVTKNQPFEAEYAVPEAATGAVVLVETLHGRPVTLNLELLGAEQREELSNFKRVRLRFIRVSENVKSLAVKVKSASESVVRITVAFVKHEAAEIRKKFSCRLCKQLCGLAVSALLAHFGVPYLEAGDWIDMPSVPPPDQTTGGNVSFGTNPLKNRLDPDSTVPVQIEKPVPINVQCKEFLAQPDSGPGWLKELFDAVDLNAIGAVRFALETAEWIFDAKGRLFTTVCEKLGMCQRATA